jgi:hypothetical protein
MAYKLLGMLVWKGAKLFLRRRYGPPYGAKPLVAGGLVVALVGLLVVAAKRSEDRS